MILGRFDFGNKFKTSLDGTAYKTNTYKVVPVLETDACANLCLLDSQCHYYTISNQLDCHLCNFLNTTFGIATATSSMTQFFLEGTITTSLSCCSKLTVVITDRLPDLDLLSVGSNLFIPVKRTRVEWSVAAEWSFACESITECAIKALMDVGDHFFVYYDGKCAIGDFLDEV